MKCRPHVQIDVITAFWYVSIQTRKFIGIVIMHNDNE